MAKLYNSLQIMRNNFSAVNVSFFLARDKIPNATLLQIPSTRIDFVDYSLGQERGAGRVASKFITIAPQSDCGSADTSAKTPITNFKKKC